MNNLSLRAEIAESRLKRYEIAAAMGIAETSFSRLFRRELTAAQVTEVRKAIKSLLSKEGREGNV